MLRLATAILPNTRFHIRGLDMKYIVIAGCSLGMVMSMVVGTLITPSAALATKEGSLLARLR